MSIRPIAKRLALACAAASLVALTTCGGEYVCNTRLVAAIQVAVVDSITGAPAAAGAKLVLKRGSVDIDSASSSADSNALDVGWSAGTYDLVLTHAGYLTWTRSGVTVPSASRCHDPQTVFIKALIQKIP